MELSFRGVLEEDVLHRDEGALQMCIRTLNSLIADLMCEILLTGNEN